ncbi:low affinity iron permease family protein [Caulobacter sp. UNC279MFTsu5.1]|uniref:low affinity iron permease family protein n=1 Tax=Caulobacter sp. UNC279MFTsu5.1 TaxID=1502775 RepID=UPI0008EE53FB|nr:low affinity iron permease family protein [Caulobacter sp. UNC279MFTsu5.1]SFJ06761.1 Low affinity Fe/Cu permease [Caulobacter sp. UNC279MFTsu5.1]
MDKLFAKFANATARITGSPPAFLVCVLVVLAWAASGPIFKFSETWQLVINTGTTIITFLMVFLIQNTQNRDGAALQTKLDELILTSAAENDFMGIEKLTEKELAAMHARCTEHARIAQSRLDKVAAERESRKGAKAAPKARRAPPKRPPAKNAPARRVRTSS